MTRFQYLNICAAVALVVLLILLPEDLRWWGAGAVVAVHFVIFSLGLAMPQYRLFCRSIKHGNRDQNAVALTFDDGPDPATTPALLDELKSLGITATFFCVGERVAAHPDIARRIVEEGHLIANHSHRHSNGTNFLCFGCLRRELMHCQRAIHRATKRQPRFFRSPMGLTNPDYEFTLQRLGLIHVAWEFRALDRGRPADKIVERILTKLRPGTIIVLHDGGVPLDNLLATVGQLAKELSRRGYAIQRLDELTGQRPYRNIE